VNARSFLSTPEQLTPPGHRHLGPQRSYLVQQFIGSGIGLIGTDLGCQQLLIKSIYLGGMIDTQPGALYIGPALGIGTGDTFLISPSIGRISLALQALRLGSMVGSDPRHIGGMVRAEIRQRLVGSLEPFSQRLNMVS
jgi:hypothetical protein